MQSTVNSNPVDAVVQAAVTTFIKEGKQACIDQLNKIIQEKKLKTWEVVVLSERVRTAITNNGYRWR